MYIDPKTSQKILQIVREQQDEIEKETKPFPSSSTASSNSPNTASSKYAARKLLKKSRGSDDEDEEAGHEFMRFRGEDNDDEGKDYDNYSDFEGDIEIDEQDAYVMEKFMNKEPAKKTTLADIIMGKIEQQGQQGPNMGGSNNNNGYPNLPMPAPSSLNPKIIEVYSKVGLLLSRYKSGKLPKTFKIIPTLNNWEEIIYITQPENWTPNAMYQATRIFVSNLKAKMAQRFFNLVLLDAVQTDIRNTKKLNYHYYMALKKALYKPAAFFKGFLLPLCETGSCTLKEAAIIGSVLSKVSIPALHSAAALLKIAEMDYTGPNSLFIRILLDKKYALPYKVIDALVFHFLRFARDPREMPVLWHQSLLVFAQRYKEDMTPEQKDALLELVKVKTHYEISEEVRREIMASGCRGEIKEVEMMM